MPGHKGVFFIDGIEDEIALEAEAELHAAGMNVVVGAGSDRQKVAHAEDGDATDAVGAKVEHAVVRPVAVDDRVFNHG